MKTIGKQNSEARSEFLSKAKIERQKKMDLAFKLMMNKVSIKVRNKNKEQVRSR